MKKYWVVFCCGVLVAGVTGCENKPKAMPAAMKKEASVMTISNGNKVSIDYTLTVDGQAIDTSKGRGPLTYTQGANQIVPGLEKQLAGLKVGDVKTVVLGPEEAYGQVNPQAVQTIARANLPQDIEPQVGMALNLQTEEGQQMAAMITDVQAENITIDFNHPLAGKTLEFRVKVAAIE